MALLTTQQAECGVPCQGHSHPKLSVVQGAGGKPSADEIQPTACRYHWGQGVT